MKKLLLALFVLLGPVALYAQVNLDTRIPAPQVKGLVEPENGGFGLSTLSLSGCPRLSAGVWTVNVANCTLSGSFPSTPGIANCSGTPCTSWNVGFTPSSPFPTNYIAPSGTNGQILATVGGTATWIPPSGSTSTGGSVAYVNLTNPGSYTVCPTTVTFTGGGSPSVPAAASIFCAVHGGVAVPMAIILGNAGYGYTSTPSVTITGGTGSGATAVAEMGSFVIALNTTPIPGGPANASLQNGILSIPYYPNAVTNIIPGTNVSCTPLAGGQCTGDVTISATGGGGGGAPAGNPNDIQVNGGSGIFGAEDAYQYSTTTHTVKQLFSYNTPGYNFGSPGIGPSSGGLTPSMWDAGFSSIYGQGNSTLMNFGILKTSNGDFNGINMNTAFFGTNIDGSAEGYVPFRNQHQIGGAPFNGIVSAHSTVTGGNNLTFSSHGGGNNFGAGRPAIDLTDDVQTVTVTGVSGGGSSGTYTTATVSGTPFSVSTHGTLVNEIDVTPNSNNTPTSVTYTLSLASGCSVGQMLSFGPNLLESMLIQSTGTSGGHQTVTANARMSHAAGTEYWCGGWAGRYADLPANDISGIKELYYVLGTPANNQMAIARQTPGSTDGAFLGGGTYNIYHGGILVDPRDLSSGITGNAFSVVSDNDASWTVGSHAEVSNGMYVVYSFNNDVSTGNLNPYSIGNHFSIGCVDGDASCGDLNAIGNGSQTIFSLVNGNNPNLYTTGGGLWHRDEVFQLGGQGSWGTFAHFYTNPVAPMFEWGTTNTNGFNIFQVDDHAAFMQWTGSSQTWTWDGLNFAFGSGAGGPTDGANYTWRGIHHFLPATTFGTGLDFTETTNPFTPTAGHDYLYSDATAHCLEYSANGGSFACLGSGGGGSTAWSALTNPTGNLALTMGANTTTLTYGATTSTPDLFALTDTTSNTGTGILFHAHTQSASTEIPWQADSNGVGWQVAADGSLKSVGSSGTHGITIPAGTAPSGAAAKVVYASDATNGFAEVNENNTGLSRVCTAANGICAGGGGGIDTRPMRYTNTEYTTIAPGGSFTFSTSPTSPSTAGTITQLHITFGVANGDGYTVASLSKLQITCDGDTETVPIGLFFAGQDNPVVFANDWMANTLGYANNLINSMNRKVEINYSTGCSLTFINASYTSSLTFFSDTQYRVGANVSRPSRQHWRATYVPQTSVAQYATLPILNTTGITGSGEAEFYGLWVVGNGNLGFDEGDPTVSTDGSIAVESGGTEDFFGCGYNCGNTVGGMRTSKWGMFYGAGFTGTASLLTTLNPYDQLTYRFFVTSDGDNVPFSSSLAAAWPNGQSGQGTPPGTVQAAGLLTWWTQNAPAAPVTFSPGGGQISLPATVTLSSATSGATICYTTDGSAPIGNGAGGCTHGTSGTSVSVTVGETVNAIATKSGFADSAITGSIYAASASLGYVTGTSTINLSTVVTSQISNPITFSAGDHAIIFCREAVATNATLNVISSNAANQIVSTGQVVSTSGQDALFYVDQMAAGSTTFTCTANIAVGNLGITVLDYSAGATHFYNGLNGELGSTTTPTTGAFSTGAAGLIVACFDPQFGAGTLAAGNIGGSAATIRLGGGPFFQCEDRTTSSAQTGITANMSNSNAGAWGYGVITFQ